MTSVLGQAEDALTQNIAEYLRGARANAAAPREKRVELPLAVVGRERARRRDLGVRSDDLRGHVGQVLVHLAPEELRRRPFRPRRLAAQDLGEAAVAVELEAALGDGEARDSLPH